MLNVVPMRPGDAIEGTETQLRALVVLLMTRLERAEARITQQERLLSNITTLCPIAGRIRDNLG